MRLRCLISFIIRSDPRLFCFLIEISFTSTPCSNMTIGIKFFILKTISVFPVWFLSSDKLPWNSIKVISISFDLCIIIITRMSSSIWLGVSLIGRCYPWLFSFIVEIILVFCPECLVTISIELFSSSSIAIGPERFDSLVEPVWFWLVLSVPGWFLC